MKYAYSNQKDDFLTTFLEGIVSGTTVDNFKQLSKFMVEEENFDLVKKNLKQYGFINQVKCFNSHSSQSFWTYVCHVTYEKHNSGNQWIFYIFKQHEGFVGTRLGISEMLGAAELCVGNLSVEKGVSGMLKFTLNKCQ